MVQSTGTRPPTTLHDTPLSDMARIFGALADETRLRMLAVLHKRECCVGEVEQALDIAQCRTSRNLAILRDAGLIRARRDGAWVVYYINRDWPLARDLAELSCKALAASSHATHDARRLKTARCNRQQGPDQAEALP